MFQREDYGHHRSPHGWWCGSEGSNGGRLSQPKTCNGQNRIVFCRAPGQGTPAQIVEGEKNIRIAERCDGESRNTYHQTVSAPADGRSACWRRTSPSLFLNTRGLNPPRFSQHSKRGEIVCLPGQEISLSERSRKAVKLLKLPCWLQGEALRLS